MDQPLYKLDEVARLCSVSRKTVLGWRTAGVHGNKLEAFCIGRHVRVKPEELERFLNELPKGVGGCCAQRSA